MNTEEHLNLINNQLKDFYKYSVSMETYFEQREKQLLQEFEKEDPILWNQKYYYHTVIFFKYIQNIFIYKCFWYVRV